MASSRRRVALLAGMAALFGSLAACDALIGLGKYSTVPADGGEGMGIGPTDAANENDSTTTLPEAGAFDSGDASDASDVTVLDATPEAEPPEDVSVDAPSLVTLWAHWPMPNPDAATAPDSGTLLPNQMAYDLGPDGGSPTAFDTVTKLTWLRAPGDVSTLQAAADYCGTTYQVPTRIQLASLIDFTQNPTINATAFPLVSGYLCTVSQVIEDGGWTGKYWTIDFNTGLTSTTTANCNQVLCVEGP